ncbi:MAG: hypothetical protein ACKERG_04730 [Candidatus Hodgkinia cicadicola]
MLYSAINERWTLTLATANCAKAATSAAAVRLQHSVVKAGRLLIAAEFKNWRLRLRANDISFYFRQVKCRYDVSTAFL